MIIRFLELSATRDTVLRAVKVAFVITPILTVINHYAEIADLRMGLSFWGQVVLTFLVPYGVSTYSSAMTALAAELGGRRKEDKRIGRSPPARAPARSG